MTTLHIYSIYDCKADAFLLPFFAPNDAMALRIFAGSAAGEGTVFAQFPADFTLFRIGEWFPAEGKIEVANVHYNLGTATQALATPKGLSQ